MSLWLAENPIDSQHVVKDFIEQHQWHVQFFFIEYLKPGFDVVSQFFSVDRNVVLRQPVAVQDWSTQSGGFVHSWEMFQGHDIDVFVRPASFGVFD